MNGRDNTMTKVMKKVHQMNKRLLIRSIAESFWRMQFESIPENCFVSKLLTGGTADPLLFTQDLSHQLLSRFSLKLKLK